MISDLLQSLSEEEIQSLSEGSTNSDLAEGEALFRPGDAANSLYIVYTGEIVITSDQPDSEETDIKLGPGDFFGELAAMEGRAHSATAIATRASSVVELRWDILEQMMSQHPQLLRNLTHQLAERKRLTDHKLTDQVRARAAEYRRFLARATAVMELARQVNNLLDWDDLWQRLLDFGLTTLNAERGTVYLLDSTKGELTGKIIRGAGLESISLPLGHGLAGVCALTGDSLIVADAQADPRFAPEFDAITGYNSRAIICAPFKDASGQTLGVLQLINSTVGSFNRDDLDYLTLLGDQFTLALSRAAIAKRSINEAIEATVPPLCSRIRTLLDPADPTKSIEYAQRFLDRAALAFGAEVETTLRPLRFHTFITKLVEAAAAAWPDRIIITEEDIYSGFVTADVRLLEATFEQLIADAVETGAQHILTIGKESEEVLEMGIERYPVGETDHLELGIKLAARTATAHKGLLIRTSTPRGGERIVIRLPLAG